MSLPKPKEEEAAPSQRSYFLSEAVTVVQNGVRTLFGDTEAELMQQLVYWRESPFEDKTLGLAIEVKEYQGHLWVRVPPHFFHNPFTGRFRHKSSKTLNRAITNCRSQGTILTANLNWENPKDTTNWYAVVEEVVNPQCDLFESFLKRAKQQRREWKKTGKVGGHTWLDNKEQELWEEFQRELQKLRDDLAAAGMCDPGAYATKVSDLASPQEGQNVPRVGTSNEEMGKGRMSQHKGTKSPNARGQNVPTHSDKMSQPSKVLKNPLKVQNNIKQQNALDLPETTGTRQPVVADVVESISSTTDEPAAQVLREMQKHLSRTQAEQYLQKFGPEQCRKYLREFDLHRRTKEVRIPGSYFHAMLEEGWATPMVDAEEQAKATAARRAQEQAARAAQAEERRVQAEREEAARDAAQVQADAETDAGIAALSEAERRELEGQARVRLGVLGEAGRAGAALVAMKRTVFRERAGRAQLRADQQAEQAEQAEQDVSRETPQNEPPAMQTAAQVLADQVLPQPSRRGLTASEQRAVLALSHKLESNIIGLEDIDEQQGDWDDEAWERIKAALSLMRRAA